MTSRGSGRLRTAGLYAIFLLLSTLVIYPMFWLLMTSLKDSWSIFKSPWGLPAKLHWINFENAWIKGALGMKFVNSLMVDLASMLLILAVSLPAAYVLGRFKFRASRLLYMYFVAGLALPVFLGIVPLFILLGQLRVPGVTDSLLGSRAGLVFVYAAYSLSFTIFVMVGFYRGLPGELAEAAVIDGCSAPRIFWNIMLPLSKPGIATASIFVFIGLWNEYPLALVLLPTERLQTLPLGIANLTMTQKYQADWGALFAGLAVGVVPAVLLFVLFQKQIQAGLTAGAVKG
jgi:N-acetylglucosamine transport system permease protein